MKNPEMEKALVVALAQGKTQVAAAELCGVSARTVRRRLRDPEFHAKVEKIRQDMIDRAIEHLAQMSVEAVLRNVPRTPAN